jgi:hypothetical protein
MKSFSCTKCTNRVYFDSSTCVKCRAALGFKPDSLTIVALEATGTPGVFAVAGSRPAVTVRCCANMQHGVCNWLTDGRRPGGLCRACALNRTIPNLAEPGNLTAWRDVEHAKKRLIYSLMRFGLPFDGPRLPKGSLAFDVLRNAGTGHLDGVITIDVTEADGVERERQRQHFQERYRSLLGHLRHESGHFYWMLLMEAGGRLDPFRALFGSEKQDYGAALARHHAAGPPADWQVRHVSAYASAHPWEDWAETWAHYIHMVDALDTAEAVGMEPRSAGFSLGSIWPYTPTDVYRDVSFEALLSRWIPLTVAMNDLSRSMGHADFYPFVLSASAEAKLAFVHAAIRKRAP